MHEQSYRPIRRDEQVAYAIELQGVLDPSWAETVGGMTIHLHHNADGVMITRLVGRLADQAALAGVLDLAFTLGLPLLSVAYLDKGYSVQNA